MVGVLAAAGAELRELQLLGVRPHDLRRRVVALATNRAFQCDDDPCSCHDYLFFWWKIELSKRAAKTRKEPTPLPRLLALRSRYSRILVTTPAPTVLPPSRMAKRGPSSQAIGVISSTSRFTLSPGMTISAPSGSVTSPVPTVVRKKNCGRYPLLFG